jgi:hypothetical protein
MAGTVTQEELLGKRNGLSAEWSPDNPMEDLWVRITLPAVDREEGSL